MPTDKTMCICEISRQRAHVAGGRRRLIGSQSTSRCHRYGESADMGYAVVEKITLSAQKTLLSKFREVTTYFKDHSAQFSSFHLNSFRCVDFNSD